MPRIQRYCAGCGRPLRWAGSCHRSRYCCEGCARGDCTCGAEVYPAIRDTEERRRDAYRVD